MNKRPTEKLEQKELQSELDEIMLMIRVNRNSEVGKMKHRNIRYAIQTLINSEVASAVNEAVLVGQKSIVADTLADLDVRGLEDTKKRLGFLLNELNDKQSQLAINEERGGEDTDNDDYEIVWSEEKQRFVNVRTEEVDNE